MIVRTDKIMLINGDSDFTEIATTTIVYAIAIIAAIMHITDAYEYHLLRSTRMSFLAFSTVKSDECTCKGVPQKGQLSNLSLTSFLQILLGQVIVFIFMSLIRVGRNLFCPPAPKQAIFTQRSVALTYHSSDRGREIT